MKINKIFEYSKDVFSQFDVTEKQMNDMISLLSEYESSNLGQTITDLKDDILSLKSSNWTKLSKWRVKSILDRFEICNKSINELKDIEDFIVEVTDEGWNAKIDFQNSTIIFVSKSKPISKLNTIFSFLYKNHRLAFKLKECTSRSGDSLVRVEYKFRDDSESNDISSKIQHALSDEDD